MSKTPRFKRTNKKRFIEVGKRISEADILNIKYLYNVEKKKMYEISEELQFDIKTISKWCKTPIDQKKKLGRPPKNDANEIIEFIISEVEKDNTLYLREIQLKVREKFNENFSINKISDILKKRKYNRKRCCYEHRNRKLQRVIDERKRFREWIENVDIEKLIFFDECHFNLSDTNRKYGRSKVGKRAVNKENVRANASQTLMGAIDFQGNHYHGLAEHSNKTATNSDSFLDQMGKIIPKLPDGKILILDNCSIHKSLDATLYFNVIQAERNILVKFLPPYSPDYNPIELLFNVIKSKLKQDIRLKSLNNNEFGLKVLEIAKSSNQDSVKGFYAKAEKCWKTNDTQS